MDRSDAGHRLTNSQVKYSLIEEVLNEEGNLLSVYWLCKVAGVSRSGYYNWLTITRPNQEQREEQDKDDFKLVLAAFHKHTYKKGSRSIYMTLLHERVLMNRKKILRLMRKFGLFCTHRRPRTQRKIMKGILEHSVKSNLVQRQFKAFGPRTILLTDITYCLYNYDQRAYLSTIKDAYTNEILAYQLSASLEVEFVLATINQLIKTEGMTLLKETIVHSDQGSHYTSMKFQELLADHQLIQSMSRRGNCWDNAPQESFFGHMKDDVDIARCQSFEELQSEIDTYMDYYNHRRYQWGLAKLAPRQYYDFVTTGHYPLADMIATPDIPAVRTCDVNESILDIKSRNKRGGG